MKDIIKGIGANKTEEAIVRSSKALGTLHNMLSQFDKDNHLDNTSEVHRPPSCKRELNTIIKELKTHQVFEFIDGRTYKTFPKPRCILRLQPRKKVKKWLKDHIKKRYFK